MADRPGKVSQDESAIHRHRRGPVTNTLPRRPSTDSHTDAAVRQLRTPEISRPAVVMHIRKTLTSSVHAAMPIR